MGGINLVFCKKNYFLTDKKLYLSSELSRLKHLEVLISQGDPKLFIWKLKTIYHAFNFSYIELFAKRNITFKILLDIV